MLCIAGGTQAPTVPQAVPASAPASSERGGIGSGSGIESGCRVEARGRVQARRGGVGGRPRVGQLRVEAGAGIETGGIEVRGGCVGAGLGRVPRRGIEGVEASGGSPPSVAEASAGSAASVAGVAASEAGPPSPSATQLVPWQAKPSGQSAALAQLLDQHSPLRQLSPAPHVPSGRQA